MTDVNNEVVEQEVEQQEIDFKAEYEKLKAEKDKILNKNKELLTEKQKEQEKRREAEAQAELERVEKLKKDGDYKSIVESAQRAQKELEDKLHNLTAQISQKEIRQAAIRLANELNPIDGDAAETLADYIEKRLKHTEHGILVTNKEGELSVIDTQQLKEEFRSSNKFKPLISGTKATGGGAPGNTQGQGAKNELSRADFDAMSHEQRRKFFSSGGKLI